MIGEQVKFLQACVILDGVFQLCQEIAIQVATVNGERPKLLFVGKAFDEFYAFKLVFLEVVVSEEEVG
jgi:hypothetical protein